MSEFPLNIPDKEDTPERLQALADVPLANKILASEFTKLIKAIEELSGRSTFIEDNNGLEWFVRKASVNLDNAAFQKGDRIEAFIDLLETDWVEGVIMGAGFTGVADLDDPAKFFKTNGKTRRS